MELEIVTTTDGETLQRTPVETLVQAKRALTFYRLMGKSAWVERQSPGKFWEILTLRNGELSTWLEVA